MSIVMVVVLLIAFSFVVHRVLERFAPRLLVLNGIEYVAVGIVLGPHAFPLLSAEVLRALQPIVSLSIGLVGFGLGLSLRQHIRSTAGLGVGGLSGILVCLGVGGVFFGVARLFDGGLLEALPMGSPPTGPELEDLWFPLALAGAAAATSHPLIEAWCRREGAKGPVVEMLLSAAVMSSLVGVGLAGYALALQRATQTIDKLGMTRVEWLVACISVGVLSGILFRVFMAADRRPGPDRLFLATIGVVVFTSGMAAGMGVSPLLVNAIAGILVSILHEGADRLHHDLQSIEKPTHILLFIIAGAMWTVPDAWILAGALGLLYSAARLSALKLSIFLATRLVEDAPRPPRAADGLLAQGVLAISIVINYVQVNPEGAGAALGGILPAIVMVDAFAPRALRTMLGNAGALGHIADASMGAADGASAGEGTSASEADPSVPREGARS